jgi:hypothetical protein
VPESANALAVAISELGAGLRARAEEARRRAAAGLPVGDHLLDGGDVLADALNAGDPTSTVTEFLAAEQAWAKLRDGLDVLRAFVSVGRAEEFALHERVAAQARLNRVDPVLPESAVVTASLADMAAIVADRTVVERWADYGQAARDAFAAYRNAYLASHEAIRGEVAQAITVIRVSDAYASAPEDRRDTAIDRVFGPEGAMHFAALTIDSPAALLDAAARRPLGALDQARMALPEARARVLAELRALAGQQDGKPVHEWSPSSALAGRRLATGDDVDAALAVLSEAAAELRAKIREGFVVEVR